MFHWSRRSYREAPLQQSGFPAWPSHKVQTDLEAMRFHNWRRKLLAHSGARIESYSIRMSLEYPDLRVKLGWNLEGAAAITLEVNVKKPMHAIRRRGKLAASIDTENAKRT